MWATRLIHLCDMTHYASVTLSCSHMQRCHTFCVSHDLLICTAWLNHMCAMSHLYVRHDSIFNCFSRSHTPKTSHVWMSNVTCKSNHCHVVCTWHGSSIRVARPIHMCGTTHLCLQNDSFICTEWLIYICGMAHSSVWHHSLSDCHSLTQPHAALLHPLCVTCAIMKGGEDS